MSRVTVREYARLTCVPLPTNTLDRAQVSESAFDWLCELSARLGKGGAQLLQAEGRRWLKLGSLVGVIETPCGVTLEILPKHVDADTPAAVLSARKLLRHMLSAALDVTPSSADEAGVQLFEGPLSEWVARRFLLALEHLLKRGLRFDYQQVEEEQRFLRGRLDVTRQMRQPPGREHIFQIRHDLFLPDRPENRLLKSALDKVCRQTQDAANWRLAHEMASLMSGVPVSRDNAADFRVWRDDRLMAHYQPARPWCELVLGRQTPLALAGETRGISLLFPMEVLFERYVEQTLRRNLPRGAKLTAQSARHSLCKHQEESMFLMKPDLLLEGGGQTMVLDAKWKRLDAQNSRDKYGLSQSDFYQLFAYGQYYQQGQGDMVLIYPRWSGFDMPLPVFEFPLSGLKLWVVPFDLELRSLLLPDVLRARVISARGH